MAIRQGKAPCLTGRQARKRTGGLFLYRIRTIFNGDIYIHILIPIISKMKQILLIASILLNLLLVFVLAYAVHRLGGPNAILSRIRNGGIAEAYQHRTQILENLTIDSSNIVFLGNSLTEYGEWGEFFNNNNIRNRGIAGEFTDGILRRLDPITTGKPKQVFLMIGINDLILHRPPHILSNYKSIVEQIRSKTPATELIVQSILPVNNEVKNTGLSNEDVLVLNAGIQAIAADFNLKYVDLHQKFKDPTGKLDAKYTLDGIHLNRAGYELWTGAINNLVLP